MLEGERDGWILVSARWPDQVLEWMPAKFAELENPQIARLYRVLSEVFAADVADDSRLDEVVDILVAMAEHAHATGEGDFGELSKDDMPFDLLESLAVESDPRAANEAGTAGPAWAAKPDATGTRKRAPQPQQQACRGPPRPPATPVRERASRESGWPGQWQPEAVSGTRIPS